MCQIFVKIVGEKGAIVSFQSFKMLLVGLVGHIMGTHYFRSVLLTLSVFRLKASLLVLIDTRYSVQIWYTYSFGSGFLRSYQHWCQPPCDFEPVTSVCPHQGYDVSKNASCFVIIVPDWFCVAVLFWRKSSGIGIALTDCCWPHCLCAKTVLLIITWETKECWHPCVVLFLSLFFCNYHELWRYHLMEDRNSDFTVPVGT